MADLTTTKATPARRGPRISDHKIEKQHQKAIHHGYITVPYGPLHNSAREGWHYPGGGFTTSSRVALQWAVELDETYMQLQQKKEAHRGTR